MNEHIVALPTQLCQNHCLIHHNVVRHECITCIIIPKDFIYYSIFVSHCMFILTNSYFSLHYCISLYSASSILLHLFFCSFLFLFTLYVLFLPKDRNYLPQHVLLIRVHTLCMTYGHWIFFIYICEQFLTYLNITLLFFCCRAYTNLSLLSYLYNRRLLPLWADLVCQPVQRLLYLYTYLYNSNCNMFATYLISLLAHAIYPTYLIKLYVFSNVCILDFTQSPIVQVLTEPSHVLLGVVSVSCGIDRVLPVLRPVCVTHSCHLACMCVCVGGVWRMRASSA